MYSQALRLLGELRRKSRTHVDRYMRRHQTILVLFLAEDPTSRLSLMNIVEAEVQSMIGIIQHEVK